MRFEWFTAPETDEPQDSSSFTVRLERSNVEFEVPEQKSILEVLEEHGFELPFSCREGLCGTCVTNVCSGEPDHRDYVLVRRGARVRQDDDHLLLALEIAASDARPLERRAATACAKALRQTEFNMLSR